MKLLFLIFIISFSSLSFANEKAEKLGKLFDAFSKVKLKPKSEQEGEKIKIVFTQPNLKKCHFVKIIKLTEKQYSLSKNKKCSELIKLMGTTQYGYNLIYFENIPLKCSPSNLIAKTFKCKK